jgi:hypothetical protein
MQQNGLDLPLAALRPTISSPYPITTRRKGHLLCRLGSKLSAVQILEARDRVAVVRRSLVLWIFRDDENARQL